MQLAVEAHALQHLRAVRLEPAVHVVQADARDDPGRPVEDAREERVAGRGRSGASSSPRRGRSPRRAWRAAGGSRPGRPGGRRRSSRSISPRASRNPACRAAAFPKLRRRWTTTTFGSSSWSRESTRDAAVGRAVVDEDDLERLVAWLERGRDLAVELLERALLVEQRERRRRSRHGRVSASQVGVFTARLQRAPTTMIAPPASVVGTYQLACMRIENARASFTGTSRRPERRDAEPLIRADVPGRRRNGDSERERGRDEHGLERLEIDPDRARDEEDGDSAERPRCRCSAPIQTAARRRPTGSPSMSIVSRTIRRTRPRSRRSRSRDRVYHAGEDERGGDAR